MRKIVLECKEISKIINKKEILKNVTFSIVEGDIFGLIGPNGAGKTTTIKLILGLQKLSKGHVKINGYDIKKEFKKAIEKVGAIVENPDEYSYLSGYKNLKLVANLYKDIDEKRIRKVVELVGLEKRINDKVSRYSLGMKQRLGIAIAILNKPNLLVLDEPTNGLDPEAIKELRELIMKLAKEEKMAIFISSHNLNEIEACCNKIAVLEKGQIIDADIVESLKNETKSYYVVEVNDASKIDDKKIEIISDTKIKIEIDEEDIFDFARKLHDTGIKIYEIKKEKKTLEQAFLERIGGSKVD